MCWTWSGCCDGIGLEIRNLLAKWLGKEEGSGRELWRRERLGVRGEDRWRGGLN